MPNRLSKRFSRKEKEALAEVQPSAPAETQPSAPAVPEHPPGYSEQPPEFDPENALEPPDLTAGFANLALNVHTPSGVPQPNECIAHLKFLECLYRLRQSIGSHDGLFEIKDSYVTEYGVPESSDTAGYLAQLGEKRWSIYVARAVDRFLTWWANVVPTTPIAKRTRARFVGGVGYLLEERTSEVSPLQFNQDNLPPLDVLMVWHAYQLNPRAYLEDCLRHGKMALWHTRTPWDAISKAIDPQTFAFQPSEAAKQKFKAATWLEWDNLDGMAQKAVYCPSCDVANHVPWSTCHDYRPYKMTESLEISVERLLKGGRGYCDRDFKAWCSNCHKKIDHDNLQAKKFTNDIKMLRKHDQPMAGTILGAKGIPKKAFGVKELLYQHYAETPNGFIVGEPGAAILAQRPESFSIDAIRKIIDSRLEGRLPINKSRRRAGPRLQRDERIAIRRMMSRYWNNSSPFALDLVGAVIRQGSFVEKMHNIDWLHSPALRGTMKRLIVRYERFLRIIIDHPRQMAVPTLDIDLAWHTHQLSAQRYCAHTIRLAQNFIDHDDKVTEVNLNNSFAWTSETYARIYREPYSECNCWYCEAIRESHTSSSLVAKFIFGRINEQLAERQHAVSQDPRRSVHISAHNAVRPAPNDLIFAEHEDRKRAQELEALYQAACRRAEKKGRPPPKRDDYYYSDAYGYPVFIPAYSPYVGYFPYTPFYYPVTPGCMAMTPGAPGNCCAGTCSATVASGSGGSGGGGGGGCGTGGGNCGGGCAGGCSSGGGGGCGSGGGGGGGGGGCGGGGGGGGCGGGGGG